MLDDLFQFIWTQLAIPVGPVRNPYRLMQLSSLDEQGWPVSRTVVLRDADARAGALYFYADRRSAKCTQIAVDPRVALTALSPCGLTQVRMQGLATLIEDPGHRLSCWSAARDKTQALFRHGAVPGQEVERPEVAYESIQDGFDNFAIVCIEPRVLEWLDLTRPVQQRARFLRHEGSWQSTWLAP
ncbi:pyridoxamine 5'-phosphate oxidase family protein [Pseudomonas sp. 148P]|uniref:Pyridoxamine 5'-phosphate oxidase family protein n=1 Tax=Pseudomonas ulcerans TaxID=3115852 RepID=A0ABU7HW87_9PSED|nr:MULTISPECIES: pyridoxamine 5'-phosphate oxidase family protein [unclassified Pseudomonas]MEE1924659.1 pyridoxamine 5'-phosphate oxidase family protein [Pseudomonas sp. 147P]MEE1935827.1 pyridoxamine 5'-phosphate oxidase family protein [Pseudomonas sp. 148P]